eukprot:3492222-Rhodomonas_salina.1
MEMSSPRGRQRESTSIWPEDDTRTGRSLVCKEQSVIAQARRIHLTSRSSWHYAAYNHASSFV